MHLDRRVEQLDDLIVLRRRPRGHQARAGHEVDGLAPVVRRGLRVRAECEKLNAKARPRLKAKSCGGCAALTVEVGRMKRARKRMAWVF